MSTLGADPEVLLYNETMGEFIPSIDLIGGSKAAPMPVTGGAVQEDNVTAEFNIDPVNADDHEMFVAGIINVYEQLQAVALSKFLSVKVAASAEYNSCWLEDPRARMSGCDPDMNAYTGENNVYPPLLTTKFRCAGGHIHFGDEDIFPDMMSKIVFIKTCDYFVGSPLSYIDEDIVRRSTYGKAGNFRSKPYGVEYRTPSNVWLSSPSLMRMVAAGMCAARDAIINQDYSYATLAEELLRGAMDSNDKATLLNHIPDYAKPYLNEAGYKV